MMIAKNAKQQIKMVSIDRINILNPRARNQKIFYDMAHNITQVGLKRPITVTPCCSETPGKDFDLVCGQGWLEAFMACGQTKIPAIIIDANEEQALIMSLVENLARQNRRPIDLLQGIELLKKQGYDASTIAAKTGLSAFYVGDILKLLEYGEERLLAAVEAGHIPITIAMDIASSPDDEQKALYEAYENKQLRGSRFLIAKRLLEIRRRRGKSFRNQGAGTHGNNRGKITASEVLKIYQQDANRKIMLTRKADIAATTLTIVIAAMRRLLKEEHFVTLLRAEKMTTMPAPIQTLFETKN